MVSESIIIDGEEKISCKASPCSGAVRNANCAGPSSNYAAANSHQISDSDRSDIGKALSRLIMPYPML
jgi:hypothetical protein